MAQLKEWMLESHIVRKQARGLQACYDNRKGKCGLSRNSTGLKSLHPTLPGYSLQNERTTLMNSHGRSRHDFLAQANVRGSFEVRALLLTCAVLSAAISTSVAADPAPLADTRGELEIQVTDSKTGEPLAVRMHIWDARGRAVKPRGVPIWKDHFSFFHKIVLKLRPGHYLFEVERGPEYRYLTGDFVIERGATDNKVIAMQRFVDMKAEGWWSGDLHIHRDPEEIQLLMLAEDLHIAPLITWWNQNNYWQDKPRPDPLLVQFDNNRFYHLMGGEDERGGGALLYFNLEQPLPITEAKREYPSAVEFLKMSRNHDRVHVDIEKPFWWDMPVWIASGMVHSIGLANNHLQRDGGLHNEAWGKPRDTSFYPGPTGNGRWSQDIYYHLLNCGLHLPPTAGSASGVLDNPIGYNRVYVHCGEELTWEKWWDGLRAGRVVVTNGPMIRPRVNGELPGHTFYAEPGEPLELTASLNLSLRDKVEYLEIVKNGKVVHDVRLEDYRNRRGQLPPVIFEESGWMLIRAVTTFNKSYRFATSGPFYVDVGGTPRVSRKSAQFFVDWVKQRREELKVADPNQKADLLRYHDATLDFWQQKLQAANAD